MKPITIEYTPTITEHKEAYTAYEKTTYPIVLIAIGIVDMMGFMDFGKWIYLIRLKMSIKSKSKHKVTFSENGLYFATNNIKSEIEWEFYQSFLESENTLLLIYGHRQFSRNHNEKTANFDTYFRLIRW